MSNPREGSTQVPRDIIEKANALGFSPLHFQTQLQAANLAYQKIVDFGPFYGKDVKGETPSFRVSSAALRLPADLKSIYENLGQDIALLGKVLPDLPPDSQSRLGRDWSKQMPFLWRIDSIVSDSGQVFVNEVQISDGCDGRMTGLQAAYSLATPDQSTPGQAVNYLVNKFKDPIREVPKIAFVRHDISGSPYAANNRRMHEYLTDVARGRVDFALMDKTMIGSQNWADFDGVINYAFLKVRDLEDHGIKPDQILCPGDATFIGSKGLFALLHDPLLNSFWENNLGTEGINRLKGAFIKTEFIKTSSDIRNARDSGSVVKVFDAERLSTLGAARGVFGPWDASDESWQDAYSHLDQGSGLIVQDFVRPKKFSVLLRSNRGKGLQLVDFYNKIAAKYVESPEGRMQLTGLEATLGESEKPASKGCCITAVDFE